MKSYVEFKDTMVRDIKGHLPEEYHDWQVNVTFIPKVNGFKEAVSISPSEGSCAVPNLYLNDFYDVYRANGNIEETLQEAAKLYLNGMEFAKGMVEDFFCEQKNENIVMNLINMESNRRLLSECPHRQMLDLSIIYKWIIELPDGSFNSAIINNGAMASIGLSEEEIYNIALENTKRLFPPNVVELDDNFIILTNKRYVNGATTMVYKEELHKIAERFNSDLYILPSSIHEIIVIATGDWTLEKLYKIVSEANHEVVKPEDILSESVYFYSLKSKELSLADDSYSCVS